MEEAALPGCAFHPFAVMLELCLAGEPPTPDTVPNCGHTAGTLLFATCCQAGCLGGSQRPRPSVIF